MKLLALQSTVFFALASAQYGQPSEGDWVPGGATDLRGPCPMMNTLANHGFLPREGGNITKENAIHALGAGLNFDAQLAGIMWEQARIANPTPNATFFTLDHLNRHNVLEHDASLSRSDAYFGNNHIFNQSVFSESRAFWTDDIVSAKMLANSKIARQVTSRAANPEYRFTATTEEFSLGEVAAPIIVFGNLETAEVKRDWVEYFFENERLPSELGWVKKTSPVTLTAIMTMTGVIRNATSLLTQDDTEVGRELKVRSGLHGI